MSREKWLEEVLRRTYENRHPLADVIDEAIEEGYPYIVRIPSNCVQCGWQPAGELTEEDLRAGWRALEDDGLPSEKPLFNENVGRRKKEK